MPVVSWRSIFAREAEQASGHLQQPLRRAARKAFLWPDEAYDLVLAKRSLTELEGIGPSLSRRIHEWIDEPPVIVSPPQTRREFLTCAQARRVLASHPKWYAKLGGDLHMHTVLERRLDHGCGDGAGRERAQVPLYCDHRSH